MTDAPTLSIIETLTKRYAEARAGLSARVGELQAELDALKRKRLLGIKTALAHAAEAEAALRTAIEAAPHLFVRPKTLVLHGVKIGFRKAPGKLVWDDADQVVALIKRHLPDQADVLIVTKETPSKPALAQLPAADLKRLGVRVIETGEEVLVAPTDSEVDKLVDALLKDARDTATEAA